MIPQTVADRLRSGACPLSTCEVFEESQRHMLYKFEQASNENTAFGLSSSGIQQALE